MGHIAVKKRSAVSGFPYDAHRGTPVWSAVDKAIESLVENNDLVATRPGDYIVGYICQELAGVLKHFGK
jgi:hypothetical protein